MERVSELVCGLKEGDLFWSSNGIGAPDVMVVYVPAGCRVENPIHLAYFASLQGSGEGSNIMHVSNLRVVVVVEKGGEVDIIEEFSAPKGNDECYWTNCALKAVIEEGAKLRHSYIQTGPSSAISRHVSKRGLHSTTSRGFMFFTKCKMGS